ncbi:hypothetical protein, partial [Mesorhizobium sp.]|uniref:hypothetical protein n=1 Tax=Mesorhizobium sp. TaxID=1871066 RepID=UPI0025CF2464
VEHAGLQVDDDERRGGGGSGVWHGGEDNVGGGWVKDEAGASKQQLAPTGIQFSVALIDWRN